MQEPIDFTPYGMPGCWALVNPDMVVSVPASGSTGMVMRERGDGRILFRWTPDAGMQGQSMFLQLLVARPGQTPSGWVKRNTGDWRFMDGKADSTPFKGVRREK